MLMTWFHRHILLPAFEGGVKRRATFRHWNSLEKSQWHPPEQLHELQWHSLLALLTHAQRHCPYYRNKWKELGLNLSDLKSPEQFCHWPIVERSTIREHRPAMRAQLPDLHLMAKSTGGSTGEPLHFDLDSGSNDWRTAIWHRGYSWAGAGPGTKQLYLWGVPLHPRTRLRRWKDNLYNRCHRRLILNTFDLSFRTADYLKQWNQYRPEAVIAYTGALYLFAQTLSERGWKPYSPRSIVVGAEKLHPFQRARIEEVFGAPVYETYGSREVMLIGAECSHHEGLHLSSENLYVEIVDDRGKPTPDGEEGDVVITDLHNIGMPFIRYRTGDRALAGIRHCSCGRGLPLLREITGRRVDILVTPDGRRISGLLFPHLFKDYPEVRRFLVVQDQPNLVEVHLIVNDNWSAETQRSVEGQVRGILGTGMEVVLRCVEELPLSRSGKQTVVLNRCLRGDGASVM